MRFLTEMGRLPAPADRERAKTGLERWREPAGVDETDFARALAGDPKGQALLEAVFGNSPFLTEAMIADPRFVRRVMEDGPGAAFARIIPELGEACGPDAGTAALMRALRVARRRTALVTALADIAEIWPVETVTANLSAFADAALDLAAGHLMRAAEHAGDIADGTRGYFVLGLGKLGGGELNYSSDIDIIALYEPELIEYRGRRSLQHLMVHITRELVRVLEERTSDGYVFRCDLRLRPDPGATPLAVSVPAAEIYYEGMGQNWERAAMIKARRVAGDRKAADDYLRFLVPYIWRKNLDFAAIADIHSIKRQIDAHKGGSRIKVAGHNLKLGRGGIREIEFFAQTQQLIWGGRIPELRRRGTLPALAALATAGKISTRALEDLSAAYHFLRRAEHRLQMVDDQQVHNLPEDEAALERIAIFLGYKNAKTFGEELVHHLGTVESHYAALFEEAPSLSGPGNLVFTGAEHDPETLETLERMGYADAKAISTIIRTWHRGRYAAMRSARAREILTELVPAILNSFAKTASPQTALLKFDDFLSRLPAGVQLFSLFEANPGLLDLVAEIMGDAPNLADTLARRPILLDGVLSHDFYEPLPDVTVLEEELAEAMAQAQSFEGALDIARRWAGDKKFRIGVQILRNLVTADEAGPMFSDVAEASLRALKPVVEADYAAGEGAAPPGGMAILAMGRLGGREMTVGSDLDLIFVYEAEDETGQEYFSRLSRRLINAITAPTAEGELYAVDMRLRPSGASGPIASSVEAFRRYHEESAWTWEHLALTRARIVAGPEKIARAVEKIVRDALTRPRDVPATARDVFDMRGRIAKQHPGGSLLDVKYLPGGLVDAEFIVQYLQLREAQAHPEVLDTNTLAAAGKLEAAGALGKSEAKHLTAAVHLWQRILGILRLCYPEPLAAEDAPAGLRRILVKAAGAKSYELLLDEIGARAAAVQALFRQFIEDEAAPAAAKTEAK